MSTALAILPRVWAVSESVAETNRFQLVRKQPHSLRLVEPVQPTPVRPVPLPKPELAFYRKYTEKLLRRYMEVSIEAARVPSLMGRELFRGNVSHAKVEGLDDSIHFVHDVETCLHLLPAGHQHLIRRIALQGYEQAETAAMLGIGLRTVNRKYAEALDLLTAMLLERNLLQSVVSASKAC